MSLAKEDLPKMASADHDIAAAFAEALAKIASAEVSPYPFRHFVVSELFSEGVYRDLLAYLPETNQFRATEDKARVAFPLEHGAIQTLELEEQEFWRKFGEFLLGTELIETLKQKFDFQDEADQVRYRYVSRASITRSWAGYQLPPHTDIDAKVASFIIYLPTNNDFAEFGTEFYLPVDRDFECDGTSARHAWEHFERVGMSEFRMNTLTAVCRSHSSFHGVRLNDDPSFIRDTIGYTLYRKSIKK